MTADREKCLERMEKIVDFQDGFFNTKGYSRHDTAAHCRWWDAFLYQTCCVHPFICSSVHTRRTVLSDDICSSVQSDVS